MKALQIEPSIFKAYDVRGIYPAEVTADLFHQLVDGLDAAGPLADAWMAAHTSEEHAAVARELRRLHDVAFRAGARLA